MYWKCSIPLAVVIKSNVHIHTETVVQKSYTHFEFNTKNFLQEQSFAFAVIFVY